MIDILYLAYNRLEFTRRSLSTLLKNTNVKDVARLVIYDDGSMDGTAEVLRDVTANVPVEFRQTKGLGPVGITNDYLRRGCSDVFAKIDNDVMLPPGWLEECLRVMEQNPAIDLLGIEAMYPTADAARACIDAGFIGGIGLMRKRAFCRELPVPEGRFGFTAWQDKHKDVRKAWLNPALPVCLLNRMSCDPWKSLSEKYVAEGWQRPWTNYSDKDSALWEWWN